ncbi:MAG: hypothetical protein V7L00_28655 [Nostoc sp.]|uniref:hypothetical protein n=1 Tax=Nostoc sp. TaxID=1180 RepID=UPI002FF4D645
MTSALTISPAPAQAATGNLIFFNCESGSDCGSLGAFAAGVASGSVVTLIATGHTAVIAGAGAAVGAAVAGAGAAVGSAVAGAAIGTLTAVGSAVAAPVLLPLAATAAVGYVGYGAWKALNHSEPNP